MTFHASLENSGIYHPFMALPLAITWVPLRSQQHPGIHGVNYLCRWVAMRSRAG